MKLSPLHKPRQSGASLIEVLVAVLILSFGMLTLGALLAFAVQAPKLSGYRATATSLASSHVEQMRANPVGFAAGAYESSLSYDGTFNAITKTPCSYPSCTAQDLAAMDIQAIRWAVRTELPAGGVLVTCDTSPCTRSSHGNLWIVWQEPDTLATLNPTAHDLCPVEVTGTYTNPKPRCLYVRFKID